MKGNWNQKLQRRVDRTDEAISFNATLSRLRLEMEAVTDRQRKAGMAPTPKTVQHEYQTGEMGEALPAIPPTPENTLLDAYRAHLITLLSYSHTENQLAATTLQKWEYGLTYLSGYLKAKGNLNLRSDMVSVGWAKAYHAYLMQSGPMSADSATRYVKRVSECMDSHIEQLAPNLQRSAFNPLRGYQFGRAKTKEVYFLEKPHLAKFWQLDNRGKAGAALWWMGVVLLTGLDYPDAVRYVQNRADYTRPGNTRPAIEIRRSKPPKSLCRIPVWPELTALLEMQPKGEPPTADQINDYMKGVEVLINFPHRLTLKVGRKTAGYIFLLRGYTIKAVSRILGHSSIAITERYYVKTTAELVEQETDNL